jgi:serine/threonine protein phosphatase PrpC
MSTASPPRSETPPPSAPLALEAAGCTHPGRQRPDNEDAFGVFPRERLFIVADGMGGRAGGAVAARIAIDELEGFHRERGSSPRAPWPFPMDQGASLGTNILRVGLKVANQKIRAAASTSLENNRMGATVAALLVGETQIVVAHLGDVRVYRMRDGALKRLTRDHSVVEEMRAARPDMVDADLAAFAHRNVVTRALGTREEVDPTVAAHRIEAGDLYLLASDGLWGSVPDDAIATILGSGPHADELAQLLVDAANAAGGPDNITAVVIRAG